MSYFAKDHPDDVAQYLTEALPADKAVVVIGQASHYCNFQYKSPEVTRALLNAAAALIPRCEDKAAATESLLNCWLARHHPAVALSLFDEYLEPRINKTPDYPISYLWPAGLPATLERAQRFCDKRSIASTGIVSRTLGRVASFEPDLAIQWLETAAPSDLRDAATVEIVGDLTLELSNRPPLRQDAARWVELGARRTLEISSDELRAKGCEQLAALVNFLHVQPKIVLPQSIREEYARLWPNLRKDSEADYIFQMAWARPALLPDEVVEGAIRDTIRGKRMYAAPAIVAGTSWSTARKAKWYNEFLKATRAEPDLRRRASALTELAPCWRRDDPKQCLLVLWEAMQIARSLGLRRIQDGFEGVETPYVSADDSLRFGFGNKPADLRTQETLWSFAHGLESLEDRDAVLEAFVGVAAHQGQVEKAAGITSLLGNPARRARAWGAVAVVISGKPLRNDW